MVRALLGASLAALLVCANSATARAGDDPSNESLYTQIMRTLGLKDPRTMEYGINYSERSPLVVPPSRDLPPPQAGAPPPVPDWPKDADIRKRAQAKAAEQQVGPHPDYALESDRALRPDELNPAGTPRIGGSSAATRASSLQDDRYPKANAKKNIFSLDWFKKEEYAPFTGEPARTSLTDPPPGYQTPSPDQPYGISPDNKPYKPPTLEQRLEPTR